MFPEFGFVQTVQDNMKLFSKRQLAGAQRARELHERLLCPSTPDYWAIGSAGGVPGSDVTLDDVKAAGVIWGRSVPSARSRHHRIGGGFPISPSLQDNRRGRRIVADRHRSSRLSQHHSWAALHAGHRDDTRPCRQPG